MEAQHQIDKYNQNVVPAGRWIVTGTLPGQPLPGKIEPTGNTLVPGRQEFPYRENGVTGTFDQNSLSMF